jgi:hypothetical protein
MLDRTLQGKAELVVQVASEPATLLGAFDREAALGERPRSRETWFGAAQAAT